MLNYTNQDFVLTVFMKSAAESKHVGTNDTWMKLDMEGRPSVGPMMGVFHSSQVSPYLFTLTWAIWSVIPVGVDSFIEALNGIGS